MEEQEGRDSLEDTTQVLLAPLRIWAVLLNERGVISETRVPTFKQKIDRSVVSALIGSDLLL